MSAVVTLVVGAKQRLFAAHEELLCSSSAFFLDALRGSYGASAAKRISLADEEPEIFSAVLEFLYRGDYAPRLRHNKRRGSLELEPAPDAEQGAPAAAAQSTVYHRGVQGVLLKDTVIYCAAQRYGLDELKKLALRKQGLRGWPPPPLPPSAPWPSCLTRREPESGIQCSTILASARYAYANTPDHDSKLRAHYLALIIRSRGTFKRSGTMQLEMYNGGTQLFFDLFVALCNHVNDISSTQ